MEKGNNRGKKKRKHKENKHRKKKSERGKAKKRAENRRGHKMSTDSTALDLMQLQKTLLYGHTEDNSACVMN